MSTRRALFATLSVSLLVLPMLVSAARFPDVPGDHPYNSPIEALVIEEVLTGNPDGNFYPARPVNRAEFLTMLYRATERDARSVSTSCFSDVAAHEWYASVVCDAVVQGFVNGYPDGAFRPEQTVNRVEALKMLYRVFGLGVLTGEAANAAADDFTDVQAGAWYATYVSSSYKNGLLPIAGYGGTKFYPDAPLMRGEAAAYVWRAMNITGEFALDPTSSASSVSSSSSSARSRSSATSSAANAAVSTREVEFPFEDGGDVDDTKTFVYAFGLNANVSMQVDATLGTSGEKGISCRLYLLGENGLSEQYYLGFETDSSCHLRVAVPKGDYQLEVRPEDPDGTYEVKTSVVAGDGNDGFSDALLLEPGASKGGQLTAGDVADWYKFELDIDGTHTVQTFGDDLSCLIYPLSDVDLFGFGTPLCDEEFEYEKGSYVVRIQRANGVQQKLDYSVRLD